MTHLFTWIVVRSSVNSIEVITLAYIALLSAPLKRTSEVTCKYSSTQTKLLMSELFYLESWQSQVQIETTRSSIEAA